mmetsp:Transcript_6598/g.13043  ORF Transcript_6598/g.13043 Transcript_6598/m.13043 type:complete len:168 (+) Transcript_6598:117-620(+)
MCCRESLGDREEKESCVMSPHCPGSTFFLDLNFPPSIFILLLPEGFPSTFKGPFPVSPSYSFFSYSMNERISRSADKVIQIQCLALLHREGRSLASHCERPSETEPDTDNAEKDDQENSRKDQKTKQKTTVRSMPLNPKHKPPGFLLKEETFLGDGKRGWEICLGLS